MPTPAKTPRRSSARTGPDGVRAAALASALAKQCRGDTSLVTPNPEQWRAAFEEVARSVQTFSPAAFRSAAGPFRTVVLLELPRGPGADSLVAEAWTSVAENGRLVVVALNAEAIDGDDRTNVFTARELRKLLRNHGKVRILKEQPFRWLAMYVLKCDEGQRELSEDKRNRYRVTADLCRGRVLEVGCGRGHLAHHAAQRGLKVLGVDRNARKVREARERYPELEFVEADILDQGFPEGAFDTVLLPEILEHVDEETGGRMLDRAWAWLAPGGRLVVSVPNQDCIPHPNHIRWFDSETLSGLLQQYGRPGIVADQPYKWLLMFVEKPSP